MKRTMQTIGMILLVIVVAGCGTIIGGGGPYQGLSAKGRAQRAAMLAHPDGGPYSYSWTEDVMVDGKEYTKHGTAFVPE
jgi:hypothetical protein